MKAIIMAGGEGTRLRPLTCALPKPMVPILGRPVVEYTVDLLRRAGLCDITATLMYRPEEIQRHFGDSLSYYVEKEPLGTAGGVRRAAQGAGGRDTLVVMSGDSLTDIDITEAIGFHRARGALATMLLVRAEDPTEFGVVVTEQDGRILRFLEKPSPGEVLSDTINTGIYILEPEVLNRIPDGKYDFGQDLFPALVKEGAPVFGYVAEGYWCDVGDIATYMRANRDALDGKIRTLRPGEGGITIHPEARVDEGARILSPCWIGEGAVVRAGARVGPYSVLGRGASVASGASAVRSILWEGAMLAAGSEARGALLLQGASLSGGAQAYEGAVVGERSQVGEGGVLAPGALVWPHKQIEEGMRVYGNVVWGGAPAQLLRRRGARGGVAALSPDVCAALGSAAASVGMTFGIAEAAEGAASMAADAFAAGYMSAGGRPYRLGNCSPQSLLYAMRSLELSGGCAVRVQGDELLLDLYGPGGTELSSAAMRALRQAFYRRDHMPAALENIPTPVQVRGVRQQRSNDFRAAAHAQEYTGVHLHIRCDEPTVLRDLQEMLSPCATLVDSPQGVLSAAVQPDGEGFTLLDEHGAEVPAYHLHQLFARAICQIERDAPIRVASDAPEQIDSLAASLGVEVVRAHASRGAMLLSLAKDDRPGAELWRAVHFDAAAALLLLCSYLSRSGSRLEQMTSLLNEPHMRSIRYPVREGEKAAIMRGIIESTRGMDTELDHGIRLRSGSGWALVFPSDDAPEYRVVAEGYESEAADELAGFCIDLLKKHRRER